MSLKAAIRNGMKSTFSAIGDLGFSLTLTVKGVQKRTTGGGVTSTDTTVAGKGFWSKVLSTEIDNTNIREDDLAIGVGELTSGTRPKKNDLITVDSVVHVILQVKSDPTRDAYHRCLVRVL